MILDPTAGCYVHSSRGRPDGYRHEMTEADHARLAQVLHQVRGMVVLSGYHSDLYRELYAGWRTAERAARADGARPRTEVLWMNFAEAGKQKPKLKP